jgi:hypothetical protein
MVKALREPVEDARAAVTLANHVRRAADGTPNGEGFDLCLADKGVQLQGEIKSRSRRNVVQGRSFADLLEQAVRRYQNRAIETPR